MRVLLITPPMIQLNAPYPATPYLCAYLRSQGHTVDQVDLAIDLVWKLFSRDGISRLFKETKKSEKHFIANQERYLDTIEPVMEFLAGRNDALAYRIANRTLLPEGGRFQALENDPGLAHEWFGSQGVRDFALHLASLYLDDLADLVARTVDPEFKFSRYGEKLAASQIDFSPLSKRLNSPPTLIDKMLDEVLLEFHQANHTYDLIGITAPFSGCVYGAFRTAQFFQKHEPKAVRVLGGGYVNTELRDLGDERVFSYFDFVAFDAGERPIESILEWVQGKRSKEKTIRTKFLKNEAVVDSELVAEFVKFSELPAPTTKGLRLDRYLSLFEMPNLMHRLWNGFFWNKMILAHGCYWKKCSFCDTSLDYISRYEPAKAARLADQMDEIAQETGRTGFHFVDEAAPPALLKALSKELIKRNRSYTWWGNIRFEKSFDPETTKLMAQAGCVAVTGGLEVASPRVLELIQKGVTLEQAAQVTSAFASNGILVHAYLMYGFPTQTLSEAVDSLEFVRQLYQNGVLHSGFWHRFSLTKHSPIAKAPEKYRVTIAPNSKKKREKTFSVNDLNYREKKPSPPWDVIGRGLERANYNYMLGIGFDESLSRWFEVKVAKPTLHSRFVSQAISLK